MTDKRVPERKPAVERVFTCDVHDGAPVQKVAFSPPSCPVCGSIMSEPAPAQR